MRSPVPAVFIALAIAALGAVILGEYELSGLRPILAGVLFGVTVAEVVASVARSDDDYLMGAAALITEAGLVWATWISTGHALDLAATTAWIGVMAGMLAAALWFKSAGRRGARTQGVGAPSPDG